MSKYNSEEGTWITVKGRHVLIKKGQSLKDALKKKWNVKENKENKLDEEKKSEEVRNAIKSSYIYRDEYKSDEYMKQYREKYGDQSVNDAIKYYDDNYITVKGTSMDSEGLTYNNILKKDEYPKEALEKYSKDMKELYDREKYSYDSVNYNKKANDLYHELQNSKQQNNEYHNPREEVKNHLQKGEFNKARETMKNYGLEDEEEEFVSNLSSNARLDYKASKKGYSIAEDYFGKEQYEKYGDVLSEKYAGMQISKRFEDANKPNGLSTIAKEIGAKDEIEVVKALEGMAKNGKVKEIDDGTYLLNNAQADRTYKVENSKKANYGEVKPSKADVIRFQMGHGMSKDLIKSYVNNRQSATNKVKVEKPSYTKSGALNLKAFGIERRPEYDFTDDGTSFTYYDLPNGLEMSKATYNDDVYLSIRTPYNEKIKYDDYSNLPHYSSLDKYNGVNKKNVNLNDLIANANEYAKEYNQLLKSKGLPELETGKKKRVSDFYKGAERKYNDLTRTESKEYVNQRLDQIEKSGYDWRTKANMRNQTWNNYYRTIDKENKDLNKLSKVSSELFPKNTSIESETDLIRYFEAMGYSKDTAKKYASIQIRLRNRK